MTEITQFLDALSSLAKNHAQVLAILGAIASPGGIWFWVDKFRNRTKAVIRSVRLEQGALGARALVLEVENISTLLTSLEPQILCTFVDLKNKRRRLIYAIQGKDRRLPPHELKTFVASHADLDANLICFSKAIKLYPRLNRGSISSAFYTNIEFKKISRSRYVFTHFRAAMRLRRSSRN